MAKNLYEVLGVSKDASVKEIRGAYRKLARKFHPDVAPNDKAAESRFKEVGAAFEVLSNVDKRKKYDKYGDRWEHADQIEEAQQRQSAGSWGRNGGAAAGEGAGDFGSIFENLFRGGRGGGRQAGPRRGQYIETPIDLTLEEAYRGTNRQVRLQGSELCRTCGGSGEVAGATCHVCQGSGETVRDRRIEVKVPAGVKTGSRVRVAGEGRAGAAGGPNGDLYLVVTVQPHSRFERKADDLYVEIGVPYVDAVLGGEVEVPTIDGRVALRLPELTQNGRQFRLAGKGMPGLGPNANRGDLFAKVRVQLPERLSLAEREHFEALRSLTQPATV